MKNGQFEVGDQVTVYHQDHVDKEVCDLGETHSVPVYAVKRLTITDVRNELVPHLGYDHDMYGDVLYATDAQGREYRKEPHWDGPRASAWLRINQEYGGNRLAFTQYPRPIFSRDLAGRPLRLR